MNINYIKIPKEKKYLLIEDGCLYDICYTESIQKARQIFSQSWKGEYTIISRYDKHKNVILK